MCPRLAALSVPVGVSLCCALLHTSDQTRRARSHASTFCLWFWSPGSQAGAARAGAGAPQLRLPEPTKSAWSPGGTHFPNGLLRRKRETKGHAPSPVIKGTLAHSTCPINTCWRSDPQLSHFRESHSHGVKSKGGLGVMVAGRQEGVVLKRCWETRALVHPRKNVHGQRFERSSPTSFCREGTQPRWELPPSY